jgi:hypothetical protein
MINNLLMAIRRKEVRGLGKKSRKMRAFDKGEVDQIINKFEGDGRLIQRYIIPAFFKLQIHMMGRIDCISHLRISDITSNIQYPFTLLAKICWSKNIYDERSVVDQIVIGSQDSTLCVLTALAIMLENFPEHRDHLFCKNSQAPNNFKKAVSDGLRNFLFSDSFHRSQPASQGPIGSHSFRKFSATRARRMGASKDDTNKRGRWKGRRCGEGDNYIDPVLPFQDGFVAGLLCFGGPVRYALQYPINADWLLTNVCPNINSLMGRDIALILALPLLHATFEQSNNSTALRSTYMPVTIVERIISAYRLLDSVATPIINNPVKKIPLNISGREESLIITDAVDASTSQPDLNSQGNHHIQTNLVTLNEKVDTVLTEVASLKSTIRVVNQNVVRLNSTMHFSRGTTANAAADSAAPSNSGGVTGNSRPPTNATLCPAIKNLHDLWREYEVGLGNRKAAKLFTPAERGQVTVTYSRRNNVWEIIRKLVNAGFTSDAAIAKIYSAYGERTSISQIIQKIISDRKNNRLPRELHP